MQDDLSLNTDLLLHYWTFPPQLIPSVMQSSERLCSPCSYDRATLAIYLTCCLLLLSVLILFHFHSLLLSPEGSVWDIIIQYLQGCHLKNVTTANDKNSAVCTESSVPSHHLEFLYHDVNSTTIHESLKLWTWFKGSLRTGFY